MQFVYTPSLKIARILKVFNDDQRRVSQTIITIAKAIHDEQEQDPQFHFNGIGTTVSKLESLRRQTQIARFISDSRTRSTASDLSCRVKYEGYLALQAVTTLCKTPVVIGFVQAKRILLDITNPESLFINPEGDSFMLGDMWRAVLKKLEDCYLNPSHCFMFTEINKVKLFYAVMFSNFRNNINQALPEQLSALQLTFGSNDGTNEWQDVVYLNTKNAERVYREVTIDDKINVLIGGRTIRTLDDHIDYVTHLSISKLWTATSETHQLLESHENLPINV